jgi:transposase-like protein
MQITMGKCPKCEQKLTRVHVENVALEAGSSSWHGVSYCCPYCHAVLSVELDPVALKADIVKQLLDALRRKG